MRLRAADVMSSPAVTVPPEADMIEAVGLMLERRLSGLLVVDAGGRPLGVFTEGDLLRRAELGTEHRHHWLAGLFTPRWKEAARYMRERSPKVADVMTRGVVSVAPETELSEIVALMERHAVKRVAVVSEGRVAGVVSRADLLRAFMARLAEAPAPTPDDLALAGRVEAEMRRESWVPVERVHARVSGGVVDLQGEIDDERLREPLLVLARAVPGVRAVRDNLTLVEIYTGTPIGSAPEGPHG